MGVVHAWNLSSWQTQAKNLNKSQLGLHSKFQANWGYKLKPYLNKKKNKVKQALGVLQKEIFYNCQVD